MGKVHRVEVKTRGEPRANVQAPVNIRLGRVASQEVHKATEEYCLP